MNITPKISVIVPVYNTEKYLRRCIDSILTQTFTDFELLLIDDGSKDASGAICDEYAKQDSRVKVFHKENGGVSSARNLGINNAIGEWITFIDSDDTVPNDALYLLQSNTLEGDVEFVIGGYSIVNETGAVTYSNDKHIIITMSKERIVGEMFCPQYYRYWGYVCSKLYKTSLIRLNQISFNENIFFNEDRLFCVEYLCNINGKGVMLLDSCYNYYESESSAMNSLNKGYNPKFVTGFYACITMYQKVKTLILPKSIRNCIIEGIEDAYLWVLSLMKNNNAYNVQTINDMRKALHDNHLIHKIIIIEIKKIIMKVSWLVLPKLVIRYKK